MASDEPVDHLDRDGNTVGVVTRAEMRQRRLWHRSTYVLVFDTHSRLFLHLRTPTKDVFPSHWDVTIGGVLAAGESFDEGARREVREELGIDIPVEPLFPFCYEDERCAVHGMVYRALHDGPFHLQAEEIVRGEFASVEETWQRSRREPFCPDGLEVLRQYVARRDKEA